MHASTTLSRRLAILGTTVALTAAVGLSGCSTEGTSSSARSRAPAPAVTTTPAVSPTADGDAAAIVFMREEEKLARDVYAVLADTWGLPTFSNIAASEQQHMDAVGGLLDAYGIPDPAATTGPGEFTDPHLQALYDELVARGLTSRTEALRVGVLIEETDIADLAERASADPVVQSVWDRLTAGSENHLRAFTGVLARQGA